MRCTMLSGWVGAERDSQVCPLPLETEDTNGPADLWTFGILFKWDRGLDLVVHAILSGEDGLCSPYMANIRSPGRRIVHNICTGWSI